MVLKRFASKNKAFILSILLSIGAFFVTFLPPQNSLALEGDWTAGASPAAFIMPQNAIYGAGTDLFARYSVLDGLDIGGGFGIYGAKNTKANKALGIYSLRVGAVYNLDILQWVPSAGIHLSALFSEDKLEKWHRKGNGLAIDFDLSVQYRGIRHWGIGAFFSYHLVFTDDDYMTVGLIIQWYSGRF